MLCRDLRQATSDASRQPLRAELWLLLNLALRRFLVCHATRVAGAQPEDLQDIASQKALELLASAESGTWEPTDRTGSEVAGYLSAVAFNSLVDHARRTARWNTTASRHPTAHELDEPPADPEALASSEAEPCSGVECREFVHALHGCVEELQPRTRRIWFFRVFYDMTSKEIAAHPEVGLKAPHVDVLLQRCRQIVRSCMKNKGHDDTGLPSGTFVELWKTFGNEVAHASTHEEQTLDA